MRFCRIPSLIAAALFAIGANGAVNVTASRDYVDRRLTSVSNSIMEEVSSSLIKKADNSELEAHVSDTNNPHVVTASQIGAVPFVVDSFGVKTAVTIGNRIGDVGQNSLANGFDVTASGSHSHAEGEGTTASGQFSHSEGQGTTASGYYSHAEGGGTTASGYYSHAEGGSTTASGICSHADGYVARAKDDYAYSWNGNYETDISYNSHGPGTFNVNPVGGTGGFYVGEQTLASVISGAVSGKADAASVYTKAESDARISAVSNRAEEAYSAAEDMVDAVNSLAGTLGTHTRDTTNPHKVTAAQVGAVPLVEDSNGKKTAVTIGGRSSIGTVGQYSLANGQFVNASGYNSHAEGEGTTASGQFSHSEGQGTTASGYYSHAEGSGTTASGIYSHSEGRDTIASGDYSHADGYKSQTIEGHQYSFAWNGDTSVTNRYSSHGSGTFNINPVGGSDGFYIGEQTISDVIFVSITNNISAENPTFSNAVLSVGLNIDTNSVDVLNDIASTFGGFPIEGTATTVGGLLAALAAAIAWLKKNKADKATTLSGYGITDAATKTELNAKADKSALAAKADKSTTLAGYGITDGATKTELAAKADKTSLAPEYSPSSAYAVGSFVYHDGNIYQCTTAIADGGEAWNAAHWELRKLDDFFTESNSLLTGLIESKTRGKADQSDLDALAAKVDTANAALEEVA